MKSIQAILGYVSVGTLVLTLIFLAISLGVESITGPWKIILPVTPFLGASIFTIVMGFIEKK